MGLRSWLFGKTAPEPEAASTLQNPESWFVGWVTGGTGGQAGPIVNEWTALNYATLYSCVTLIAGTVASLPLKIYRRRDDGGADEAMDRREWALLQYEFNPNTSAMTGREASVGHLLTWGNCYAQIVKNRLGDPIRLQPLGPDICRPSVNKNGDLEYDIRDWRTPNAKPEYTLARDEVLHVPGFSFDALSGLSVVRVNRNAIRTGIAQEREAEKFITSGIRPPGAIQFPVGKRFQTPEQAADWRSRFKKIHAPADGSGSTEAVVLEDGATWQNIGIDPESAQLLESRKFSATEICGIYKVPPFMVGLVEKTTAWGTGIEEMTIGFVVYCLLPTLRRIEQEYNRKFFRDDRDHYCEHVLSGLLRGDTEKQARAIKIYMELGLLSVNEGRRLLGHNPVKGGEVRYYPLNYGRVDADGEDLPLPERAGPKPVKSTPEETTNTMLGGSHV